MADDQDSGSDPTRPNYPSASDNQDSSWLSASDSDTDEWIPDPFGDFTDYGLMKRLEEHSQQYKFISQFFISGMGAEAGETHIVAVHLANRSGLTRRARVESAEVFLKAVAEKCGGNANAKDAWYGGTRKEIRKILRYGFGLRNLDERRRVRLAPFNVSLEAAKLSRVDENGFRHLLLCKVIMGKMEVVVNGEKHVGPCGNESDSGVDDVENPRRLYVWGEYMNSHILPNFVVSFTARKCLDGSDLIEALTKAAAKPPGTSNRRGGYIGHIMDLVMANLKRLITPRDMAIVYRLVRNLRGKKTVDSAAWLELYRRIEVVAGDKLDCAISLVETGNASQQGRGTSGGESSRAARGRGAANSGESSSAAQGRGAASGGESSSAAQGRGAASGVDLMVQNDIGLVEGFLSELARFITPEQVAMIRQSIDDFGAKKITLAELYQRVKSIVNNDVLYFQAFNAYKSSLKGRPGKRQKRS